jgi:hypothetical protein
MNFGSLVMISVAMAMVELRKTTWVVPINVEGLLDGNSGDEEAEAEWESTEKHFGETIDMGSVFWVVAPDFVSKNTLNEFVVIRRKLQAFHLNQGSFKPCRARASSTSSNFGTDLSTL